MAAGSRRCPRDFRRGRLYGDFYLSKLAGQRDFDYLFANLDRMNHCGSMHATERAGYVPEHAKDLFSRQTLALRPCVQGHVTRYTE